MNAASRLSPERLGQIVEEAATEVYIFGQDDFRFLLVNKSARQNLGFSEDELADLHPWDIKPDFTEADFKTAIQPLVDRTSKELSFETLHVRKDGSTYDVHVRLQLISSGGVPVFYGAVQDISEQRRTRDELNLVSRNLDAILDNTTMAVFMMDERQHCSFMNKAAEELTGYTFEETQGRPLHDVVHHTYPDGRPFPIEECAIDRAFPEDNQVQGEEVFVHKDGSFYPVGFTASPMKNAVGETIGTVIEARDISEEIKAREALTSFNQALKGRVEEAMAEREALEAQLVQAQKMDAIGQLTGGIAHDFNNLLQVIGGNLQLIKQDPVTDPRNHARINNAMSGVERGSRLAAQLLAFGRQQPLEPKPIKVGRVVEELNEIFRRTLGEAVEIETTIGTGLWNCMVDRRQLETVLLNLAINARDAMKGAGKLTIETGNATLDEEYASSNPGLEPGEYAMIAVTDTGEGISEENLSKVFEPFFTTKPPGEGTGLGLSMVFGFVKQSGGHVTIYSEPGEGTTVRVYLPRTRDTVVEEREESDSAAVRGDGEVVLVVEDDMEVRATTVELLSNLGYRVIEAADADRALAIVECGIAIDLLFTDIVMPGRLRSPELAKIAREKLPGLGVLFTSGYTKNSIVHGGKLDDEIELISKPYSSELLSRKIRTVLDKAKEKPAGIETDRVDAVTSTRSMPEAGEAGPLKVLLIEDEELIRSVLAKTVKRLGHEVVEAGTLAEARQATAQDRFDAMISDVGLPDGQATDFIRDVVTSHPEVNMIVATGGMVPEALVGLDFPSHRILRKPYSKREVKAALASSH